MPMRKWVLIAWLVVSGGCARRPEAPGATTWDPGSGTFLWCCGQVRLPAGFTHTFDQGVDTDAGHFTSADGTAIVRYDIGGYAGHWANRKDSSEFRQTLVDGVRVWFGKRDWPTKGSRQTTVVAVTFPDSLCANFYVESSRPEDAQLMDAIARTFRPAGTTFIGVWPQPAGKKKPD